MPGKSRGPAAPLVLAAILLVAACGSGPPPSVGRSPGASGASGGSGGPSPSGTASGSSATGPTAPATEAAPTVSGFWQSAARALSKSGRLRIVMTGTGTGEMRFEPKASGVVASGSLASVCLTGTAYTVQGIRATIVPGNWACGASALVSAFRKSGQPVYAWSSRLPVDLKIKERVSIPSKGRWQWDYAATSGNLGGSVKATLVLDANTGRLVSGSRTDRTGTTRFTFSYVTIFAPIALP